MQAVIITFVFPFFLVIVIIANYGGLPRQAVLEIICRDEDSDAFFVVNGGGLSKAGQGDERTRIAVGLAVGRMVVGEEVGRDVGFQSVDQSLRLGQTNLRDTLN